MSGRPFIDPDIQPRFPASRPASSHGYRTILLSIAVALSAIFTQSAFSQCTVTEVQWLSPSNAAPTDHFGTHAGVSGEWLAIGAYQDDDAGGDAGAVYLYRRAGQEWSFFAEIFAGDAAPGDQFGIDVAVDGDVAVVGAANSELPTYNGAAYVFRFDGNNWVEEQKLTASDGSPGDMFGYSVDLHGTRIVAGAWADDDACPSDPDCNSGSAYIYRFDGVHWVEEQKLTSADTERNDVFGLAVDIDLDRVLISAEWDDDACPSDPACDSGSAYLFRYDGNQWLPEQKLVAGDAAPGDGFGRALSIDGERLIVGAPFADNPGSESGAAYIFGYDGNSWAQEQKLLPLDPAAGDRFGLTCTIDTSLAPLEVALVGAYLKDEGPVNAGAAYAFSNPAGSWTQSQKLIATNSLFDDRLGLALALSMQDNLAVVAAPWGDTPFENSGSVYIYPALPDLTLNVDPNTVAAGAPIQFDTFYGNPGDPAMLVVVDVNGIPTFSLAAMGGFATDHVWDLSADVPPQFGGLTVTFQAFGLTRCGRGDQTNTEVVVFQ